MINARIQEVNLNVLSFYIYFAYFSVSGPMCVQENSAWECQKNHVTSHTLQTFSKLH